MRKTILFRIISMMTAFFLCVSFLPVHASEGATIEPTDILRRHMFIGETLQLDVIKMNFEDDDVVHWETRYVTNNAIKVDQDGLVTALASGSGYVFATLDNGSEASYYCSVNSIPTEIRFGKDHYRALAGHEPADVYAYVPGMDLYNRIVISVEDPEIATVEKYKITGLKQGKTRMKAEITGLDISAYADLEVFDGDYADRISCKSPYENTMRIGEYLQLEYNLHSTSDRYKTEFADEKVVWTLSDDSDCIEISETGMVHALAYGDAVVSAMITNENQTWFRIHVAKELDSITFDNTKQYSFNRGTGNINLSSYVSWTPKEALASDIQFSSSDESVFSIDESGYGTATGEGTAIVTAVSKTNPEVSASHEFKVFNYVTPTGIKPVSEPDQIYYLNYIHVPLQIEYEPAEGNPQTNWNSSNVHILTVSGSETYGYVSPVSTGTAYVTANSAVKSLISTRFNITVKEGGPEPGTYDTTLTIGKYEEGAYTPKDPQVNPEVYTMEKGEEYMLVYRFDSNVCIPDASKLGDFFADSESINLVKTLGFSSDSTTDHLGMQVSLVVHADDICEETFKIGSREITFKVNDEPEDVVQLEVSAPKQTMEFDDTLQLTALVKPENTKIEWSSSNTNIIEVDENGICTSKRICGTASITAKAGNKTASIDISVNSPVQIYGRSLSLEGRIGVNFYLYADSTEKNDIDIILSMGNDIRRTKYTDGLPGTTAPATNKFSFDVSAKQMRDNILINAERTDGTVKVIQDSEGSYYHNGCNYTVNDYLQQAFRTGSDKLKPLAGAMITYGKYAQQYFNYNVDEDVKKADDLSDITAEALAEYAAKQSGNIDGLTYAGATLELESDTGFRLYFSLSEGREIKDYTFAMGEEKLTVNRKAGSELYYVNIEGIAAQDMDIMKMITVTDGTDELNIQYCPLSYAYTALSSDKAGDPIKNVCRALYLYNQQSEIYFNN